MVVEVREDTYDPRQRQLRLISMRISRGSQRPMGGSVWLVPVREETNLA